MKTLLNDDIAACSYIAKPDVASDAVRTHEGPILIDLDETLYLRNSTEDFLDCAQPGALALLLLRSLDALKPWRLTGGASTRDNWRVGAISTLLPWTMRRWRAKVPFFARHYSNERLEAALEARAEPPIVLTAGFRSVVTPLLAAMGFADATLIASRIYAFADRRDGKLRMAIRELGAETVSRCLVVTDSVSDLDLLNRCARPLLTSWPGAHYLRALSAVYLPGEYVSQVKHPGERYIFRSIIQQDFAFWVLSSIGLASSITSHIAGLLLLLVSFWAIYERGYVENDLTASAYEPDPKLSAAFGSTDVATPVVQPWIWSLVLGAAAVAFLHPNQLDFLARLSLWMTALIVTYACFVLYNRLDKMTRIWLYPFLQLARSAAFAVVVPIEPVGVAALGAHMLSRWAPYQIYRLTSTDWPDARPELIRLVSFVLLSLVLMCALGPSALRGWSGAALLLWSLYRARRDIRAILASAHRLGGPALRQ